MLTPDMNQAVATAVRQWHQAARTYELQSIAFADAQRQLQNAERDLHELARAIEVATGLPAPELVTKADAPIGAVTMPIRPIGPTVGPTAPDGIDAAQIVLQEMQSMRLGNP